MGIGAACLTAIVLLTFQVYAQVQEQRIVRYQAIARAARNLLAPALFTQASGSDSTITAERLLDSLGTLASGRRSVEALVARIQQAPAERALILHRVVAEADAHSARAIRRGRLAHAAATSLVSLATLVLLVMLGRIYRASSVQAELTDTQRRRLEEQYEALRQHAAELEQKNVALAQMTTRVQDQSIALEEHAAELQAVNTRLSRSAADAAETAREQAALLEALHDLVIVLDRDGQYLRVIQTPADPALPPRDERIGRGVADLLSPAAARTVIALVRDALDSRSPRRAEYAVEWPRGTRWYEGTAVPLDRGRVMYVARDITARRSDEATLRESEERYRLLARATNEIVFEIDLATWAVAWNDAVHSSLGYGELPDPDARWWLGRIHPDDAARVRGAIERAVHGATEHLSEEFRLRRGDDRYAEVLARAFLQRDEAGAPRRMIGSILDLTERHLIEQRLRQSQKMEAVGQLAGGIAHDFNNLLTVIVSYTAMLLTYSTLATEDREALEQVAIAARRASDLTRELLTFGRQRVYEEQLVDVGEMVRETARLLDRLLPVAVTVKVQTAPDCGSVRADPQQLTQIMMNLTLNASDAMPDGGTLTIDSHGVALDRALQLPRAEVPPGRYCVISVSDTGLGIPAGDQERIFEPFFTTKSPGKGTGLGLATVYGIVTQLDGRIAVFSETGQGTTFRIYLPVATERRDGDDPGEPGPQPAALPADAAAARGAARILVVDDDVNVRRVVVRVLTRAGYEVSEAEDGFDALAILDGAESWPDLVVSDLVMPRVGGQALREEILSRELPVRVLLMSGYSSGRLNEAQWPRDAAFLEKPLEPGALLDKVRELLAQDVKQPLAEGRSA